jgi:hypothetical protein
MTREEIVLSYIKRDGLGRERGSPGFSVGERGGYLDVHGWCFTRDFLSTDDARPV